MRSILVTAGLALLIGAPMAAQAGEGKAASCKGCHNPERASLAGMDKAKLVASLKAIRAGEKAHPPVLKDMSDEDLEKLAAHFAQAGVD